MIAKRYWLYLAIPGAIACTFWLDKPSPDVITVESAYDEYQVVSRGSVRELRSRRDGRSVLESAVDLADPLRLVVPYSETLYAGLFFQSEPRSALVLGLGGAGFHRLFHYAFPEAILQSVEIDPKVVSLCDRYFEFRANPSCPIAVGDARRFVQASGKKWDWIIFDAFHGSMPPAHLKTKEFYEECAAVLADDGVFLVNLQSNRGWFSSDLVTLKSVFGQVVLFSVPERYNVIAACKVGIEPDYSLQDNWTAIDALASETWSGRVDLQRLWNSRLEVSPSDLAGGLVLRDDFAPVESLFDVPSDR